MAMLQRTLVSTHLLGLEVEAAGHRSRHAAAMALLGVMELAAAAAEVPGPAKRLELVALAAMASC